MSSQLLYQEYEMPMGSDPLLVAVALAKSNFCNDFSNEYIIYERNQEWSLALGTAAEVIVDTRGVHLNGINKTQTWSDEAIPIAIAKSLKAIPIEGWRAYGFARFEFSLLTHNINKEISTKPLLCLMIPKIEIRLSTGRALIRVLDPGNLPAIVELISSISHSTGIKESAGLLNQEFVHVPNIDSIGGDHYQAIVNNAIQDIKEGCLKKVILSRSVSVPGDIDMLSSYAAGRKANNPARSFALNMNEIKAVGFSPETLVEVSAEGRVSTQPLAGTRAICSNVQENLRLKNELLSDTKEIAEHAISVNIACEELTRVCQKNSVKIEEFMAIKDRGSVQHLASRVAGQMRDDCNEWDVFKMLFPAVTATGIPKKNAIDAIYRYEIASRGLYGGTVLITDQDGFMDAALVLRSLFQYKQKTWLQAGAGIMAESTPEREMQETCEKLGSVSQYLVAESDA